MGDSSENLDEAIGAAAIREAAVRAEVLAVEEDWAAALVSNDTARIGGFLADEWVIVSESGISTREQFLSLIESGELTHSAMAVAGEARIRLYGDTAVLSGRMTSTARYLGEQFDADEWTTDVYVLREGRWLCVLSHITAAALPEPD